MAAARVAELWLREGRGAAGQECLEQTGCRSDSVNWVMLPGKDASLAGVYRAGGGFGSQLEEDSERETMRPRDMWTNQTRVRFC